MTGLPLRAQSRGGTLRLGLAGAHATDCWDARGHDDSFMATLGHGAVFDCLTEIAATGELVGELAEGWEASPDAATWEFTLRRGVRFHDGTPFTARDVIASYRLHMDGPSPAAPLLADVTGMEALGDHRLRFILASGNADFPFLLSDYHLLIYPADRIRQAMAQGIGTGLYRVERFEPGHRALLTRVEGHYKDGRAGWFDAVEALAIPGGAARIRALEDGRVDAIDRLPPQQVAALRARRGVEVIATTGNAHLGFAMQPGLSRLHNAMISLALKAGIDRPAMLDQVLAGHGRVASDHPLGPANSYWDDGLSPHRDPDQARYILQVAGLEGMELAVRADPHVHPGAAEAARLLQEGAQRVGLGLRIASEDEAAPLRLTASAGRLTEDWMFAAALAPGSEWGLPFDGRLAGLMRQARSTPDSEERRAIYGRMQGQIAREGAVAVPVHADFLDAASTALAHPEAIGSVWDLDSHRICERWWFA
ncbi:ABC transporter substrate-binding protein [Pseudoroseicyclus aestuarii]|uniref:ABC transporter substrate-binding protein n=1 Tax=Pseudoroseicyclus aestuarii TaxID=1795041 RepID=UPI001FE744E0|nr:ABC transporter substrate-binding protein [Pseudoroseicyclus aestuarii]